MTADVDVAAFVNDLDDLLGRASSLGVQNQQIPRNLTERQQDAIEKAIQDVRFDLWTGEEDKILRRIEVEFGFDIPKEQQQDTQGVERGKVEDGARDRGHQRGPGHQGAQRRAPVVRAAKRTRAGRRPRGVVRRLLGRRLLQRRLVERRLLRSGGSGGGGSGAGTDLGSGGGQSGLDSKRSQRYLDCLGKAKKPADIEKCAAILEE